VANSRLKNTYDDKVSKTTYMTKVSTFNAPFSKFMGINMESDKIDPKLKITNPVLTILCVLKSNTTLNKTKIKNANSEM